MMPRHTITNEDLPPVTVEWTTCPGEMSCMVLVPYPIYRTMDPINLDAALVYRIVATVSKRGPRWLNFEVDVLPVLDFPDEVMHAVDALEQQGWLARARLFDGRERWTPLGRDRPKLSPRSDVHVPVLPAHRRVPIETMYGYSGEEKPQGQTHDEVG
jgi:hypothetical protein